jgi:hypothetical protein
MSLVPGVRWSFRGNGAEDAASGRAARPGLSAAFRQTLPLDAEPGAVPLVAAALLTAKRDPRVPQDDTSARDKGEVQDVALGSDRVVLQVVPDHGDGRAAGPGGHRQLIFAPWLEEFERELLGTAAPRGRQRVHVLVEALHAHRAVFPRLGWPLPGRRRRPGGLRTGSDGAAERAPSEHKGESEEQPSFSQRLRARPPGRR